MHLLLSNFKLLAIFFSPSFFILTDTLMLVSVIPIYLIIQIRSK